MDEDVKRDPADLSRDADLPPSPEGPVYSEDGVDLTVIRWYLSLTPTERLRRLQSHARAIWRIRRDNPSA